MNDARQLWVLGHRIRRLETDPAYGLIEVVSPPGVAGPPPHYHQRESEFFLIVSGALAVMRDGAWQTLAAGSFVDLPPGTVHTFVNQTGEDAVWLTGWRPKGFERFFADFGIGMAEKDARARSVSDAVIQRVLRDMARYGMHLPPPG